MLSSGEHGHDSTEQALESLKDKGVARASLIMNQDVNAHWVLYHKEMIKVMKDDGGQFSNSPQDKHTHELEPLSCTHL
jgi:hypothetical protein